MVSEKVHLSRSERDCALCPACGGRAFYEFIPFAFEGKLGPGPGIAAPFAKAPDGITLFIGETKGDKLFSPGRHPELDSRFTFGYC
jgi:hypothetical protein